MVDEKNIYELSERIVREFQPERIFLFGSYACGTPPDGSDVDLLVILSFEGQSVQKAAEILETVDPRIPVDLIVRSPEQVRQRLMWNDFFLHEILKKGKVLYDRRFLKSACGQ